MDAILGILLRCLAIAAGYVAACLAASAFLNLVSLGVIGPDGPALQAFMATLIFAVPFIALFVGYFAFLPATLVILAGEAFGRRDWLSYALGGGATGLVVAGWFWQGSAGVVADQAVGPAADGLAWDDPRLAAMLVAGGMVGGLAYWFVAGRGASGFALPAPR